MTKSDPHSKTSVSTNFSETVVPGASATGGMDRTQVMGQPGTPEPKPPSKKPEGDAKEIAKESKEQILGDFKISKKLGQGGMGTVYLAQQISLDRPCALKVMMKELAKKPGFMERFIREARAMAKINHPNVVQCYGVFEEKGLNFVAMELMDGQSMQDWVDELGKLPIPDAILVTVVVAEALQHAHDLNMVHRDIKPDNILVTQKGIIKVADHGLAKSTDEDMSMTQSGTGLGTPHYMPPEQARNAKHVDNRCDIYALGVTLYHYLTGKVPFAGDSIVELITNKEKGVFQPAHRVNPQVPERLSLICDKAMAKDPKHRYQHMRDLVKDLETLGLAGETLSFINDPNRQVIRRGNSAPTATNMRNTMASTAAPGARGLASTQATSAEAGKTMAGNDGTWYVKHVDAAGKPNIGKMSTPQVLQCIRSDRFNERTQVASSAKSPFLPLTQVPAFDDETRKMLVRQQSANKTRSLADEYKKIEKQYNRQKWWNLLTRFREGTLGLLGLILYLGAIAAVIFGAWYMWPVVRDMIKERSGG